MSWVAQADELTDDPRFQAGVESRLEGKYEDAIAFFAELLAAHEPADDTSPVPAFLAPLYFQYGSTVLCGVERAKADETDGTAAEAGAEAAEADVCPPCSSTGKRKLEAAEERPSKAAKPSDGEGAAAAEAVEVESGEQEAEEEGEEEEEEGEEEEEDVDLAWKLLDVARELYTTALEEVDPSGSNGGKGGSSSEGGSGDEATLKRLRSELCRCLSRIGDLNMCNGCFGDALVEFEQVLKLRELEHDESVAGTCKVVDTNLQVALAYLEHVVQRPDAPVVVRNSEGEDITIAEGAECVAQIHAYQARAEAQLKALLERLARAGAPVQTLDQVRAALDSPEVDEVDREEICVLYELLAELKRRVEALPAAAGGGGGAAAATTSSSSSSS